MIVALLQPAGHFWPPSCEECINNPEKKGSPGQDARAAAAASYFVCAPFLGRNTLTLVLEVRSTWNKVVSLDNNNVINENFHKSISLLWFHGIQNLLRKHLNLNKSQTVSTFKQFLVLQDTGNLIPEILHPFISLEQIYTTRSHFPTLAAKKKSKRFKNNNYTKDMRKVRRKALVSLASTTLLSWKHTEYHCIQTEKHHNFFFS